MQCFNHIICVKVGEFDKKRQGDCAGIFAMAQQAAQPKAFLLAQMVQDSYVTF
jgi:hypothetical protein